MSRNPFGEDDCGSSGGDLVINWKYYSTLKWLPSIYFYCEILLNIKSFATPQSRTLASQQRALASIGHSEQVGVNTLEELAEQREKLDRAEQRLHEIGELQKDSQKQIGALQSWWKSWFTKK